MAGEAIVTVTLNAPLHVAHTADNLLAGGLTPVSRPRYRAGGRGVTVARALRAFGHDVLAAGLVPGELLGDREHVDMAVYGRLADAIRGEPSAP